MDALKIGSDMLRFDAKAKVTGCAKFTIDQQPDGAVHAVLVEAECALGRVLAIDVRLAERVSGVLLVLHHQNVAALAPLKFYFTGGHAFQSLQPLQSDHIAYRGQTVAAVFAVTLEAAREAALLVKVTYEAMPFAVELVGQPGFSQADAMPMPMFADKVVGQADAGLRDAAVVIDQVYTTPAQHHNPIELVSVVADWSGADLTVWTTAQGTENVRQGLAIQLGIDPARVRVLAPLIGGSFGQKAALGPHVALAAIAARRLGRPVKLELTRSQGFHSTSYRPATRQHVRLGATREGRIEAAIHEITQQTSRHDLMPGFGTDATARLYGIRHFRGDERLVQLDTQTPGFMRAPFEMAAVFAFESAVDELAIALGQDPVALRLANDVHTDPISGKPFTSRHVAACLRRGAERFGWGSRDSRPASMVAGDGSRLGFGVALGIYKAAAAPTLARARMLANGTVDVSVAAHEMGQGIGTVIALVLADRLGLRPAQIRLVIGDTAAPPQHITAGSWGTATVAPAIHAVGEALRRELIRFACETQGGRLHGIPVERVTISGGAVIASNGQCETFSEIMRRVDVPAIEVSHRSMPPGQPEAAFARAEAGLTAPQGPVFPDGAAFSYAAHFVEVHVRPRTFELRVARIVSVIDCGTVISPRTARSQALGGLIWGVGSALHECSPPDLQRGGFLHDNLADYVIPTLADVPQMDVTFIDQPDPVLRPLGAKGLGEVAMVGIAAAIANAVHHATGMRVRRLPIRAEALFA